MIELSRKKKHTGHIADASADRTIECQRRQLLPVDSPNLYKFMLTYRGTQLFCGALKTWAENKIFVKFDSRFEYVHDVAVTSLRMSIRVKRISKHFGVLQLPPKSPYPNKRSNANDAYITVHKIRINDSAKIDGYGIKYESNLFSVIGIQKEMRVLFITTVEIKDGFKDLLLTQ
ncbi:hypothetical protein DICVIV_11714 [Dictyocaulus viviparus]|uniref:Uncharacterized protein n=1 Tax=Dictyocaulus viviparus TaxID=29172 RepID=A0A0D8XCG0_DICVI|nr:hypothetical protein DICVIV_11714 [Dictyocaulus viviparus]